MSKWKMQEIFQSADWQFTVTGGGGTGLQYFILCVAEEKLLSQGSFSN